MDVRVDEMYIRALQHLQAGWIRGSLKTEKGVCMMGGLREAATEVLRPLVTHALESVPAYTRLPLPARARVEERLMATHVSRITEVLRQPLHAIIQKYAEGQTVESFNDERGRKFEEIQKVFSETIDKMSAEIIAHEQAQLPKDELQGA